MKSVKKGDLVYVPSHTLLFRFEGGVVTEHITTHQPAPALMVSDDCEDMMGVAGQPYCEILYGGRRWSIPKHRAYALNKTAIA